MGIVIDREFKSLIPPLQPEERSQLESNILAEGCRDPLVVWDGVLIDGHNRLEICTKHDVKFEVIERQFVDRSEAMLWIIDNQMGRRNLADIDRIALQLKRKGEVAKEAKKRETDAGNRGSEGGRGNKKPVGQICPTGLGNPTRKVLATSAGVGERTFDAGEKILNAVESGELPKEDLEAIRRKEKSIHRVAKDLKERRQKEKRESQRKEAAKEVEQLANVHVGDFRELADVVPDLSLSLIFTDPPYDRKSTELFDGLGEFAADKLAVGGSLICYVGQTQIPDAIEALRNHLRYWWVICGLHAGGKNLMREYGVRCGWKAVLWFVHACRDDPSNIVQDVMAGGREKSHHEWQQAQSEAEYWIERLCPEDGIVCDPFLGGGTTGAAATKLGRKWLGFEINEDQARIASERISNGHSL